jgi:5'-3' exonuclease
MIGLIDGGNFFKRCLFSVLARNQHWDMLTLYDRYEDAINEISNCANTNKIVLALDNGTWRNQIHPQYKESREIDEKLPYDIIKNAKKVFYENFMKFGGNIVHGKNLEADDIIYKFVEKYKNIESIVIFSADSDLKQLLYNGENSFCVQIDLINRKLFVKKSEELSFECSDYILSISKLFKLEIEQVNPFEILFEKILCGDASDDIPAVFVEAKMTTAGLRNYRFTAAKEKKVLDVLYNKNKISENVNFLNFEFKNIVIENVQKLIDNKATAEILSKSYDNNCKLIWLDNSCYPFDILANLNKICEKNISEFDLQGFENINKTAITYTTSGFNMNYWKKYLNTEYERNNSL